jgi:DNA-binding NtrC family response regulator
VDDQLPDPGPVSTCEGVTASDWSALNLIGESPVFRDVLKLLLQWASVNATVLLYGETGTGKELAARAVHYFSERRCGPFVPLNCGAVSDELFEAEFFGHAKGAYTDAKGESRGVVGLAEGGTLFLDEIDSLSPRAQAAILRFVQDRSYRPLGSMRFHQADVRLIAASNADLADLSQIGRFRPDLLFRLDLLALKMPPLRERPGDALLLAEAFVRRFCVQYRMPGRQLNAASRAALCAPHPWPGNVRELEHRVHRCFLLSKGPLVELGLAPGSAGVPSEDEVTSTGFVATSFAEAKARVIADFERRYVRDMLQYTQGNVSEAARLAGKERSRFGRLVRKYELHRSQD